jgi:hypothetical protein
VLREVVGEWNKIFLFDVFGVIGGRPDKIIRVEFDETAVEFVMLRPLVLVWCVELAVLRVTD